MRAFIFLLILINAQFLAAQNFEWVKQIAGTSQDYADGIHLDNQGNVYLVGGFSSNDLDMDPDTSVSTLINQGGQDAYVAKYSNDGNLLWAKSMGGSQVNDRSLDVVTDAFGNVYCTGRFSGTANFDPGIGDTTATSNGNFDVFLAKFDSSGNFLWVRTLGGTEQDIGRGVEAKNNGNVVVVGEFQDSVNFDPGGPGSYIFSAPNQDIFVAEYTSAGNLVYARQIGGSNNSYAECSASDEKDNILIGGYFYEDTIDCDPGPGTFNVINSTGGSGLLVSLDANGDFNFAKQFYGDINLAVNGWSECNIYGMTTDSMGNVYTCGELTEAVNFDPGGSDTTIVGVEYGMFITKSDSMGNLIWVQGLPHDFYVIGVGISVDPLGRVYVTGDFRDTLDFDPGPGVTELGIGSGRNTFVLKLDSDGSFMWVRQYKGDSNWGEGIFVDSDYDILTAGVFGDTVDFDTETGPVILGSLGNGNILDIYLHKFSQCPPTFNTDTVVACDVFTWTDGYTYSSDTLTEYRYLVGVITGCDSLVRLDLTINSVNNGVIQVDDSTLQAVATNTQYQWLDCDNNFAVLVGDTFQTFHAAVSGNYAVEITENGCVDTSTCTSITILGVLESGFPLLSVSPNPTNGRVDIDFGSHYEEVSLRVYDVFGKIVLEESIHSASGANILLDQAPGSYILEIGANGKRSVVRIVKW